MQIVNYLENGQENMTYPDREATFIRNHPFMTQLDFFDMQEDQQRAWAGEERKKEAEKAATEDGDSAAIGRATAPPPQREPPQEPPEKPPEDPPEGPGGPPGGGGGGGSSGSCGGGDAGGKGDGKGPGPGKKKDGKDSKPPPKGPGRGGGGSRIAGNIKRRAIDGSLLIDPMMSAQPTEPFTNESTDVYAEMAANTERSFLGKIQHMVTPNSHLLVNRSHIPDAMPDDNPLPTSDGKFHRNIGEPSSPQRGHKRNILDATGLDGETFKYAVGSASSASSSAATAGAYIASGASASGSLAMAVAARGARGVDNIAGHATYYGPVWASNLGHNVRDTARILVGGTVVVLNFASENLLPAPYTDEERASLEMHQFQAAQRNRHASAKAIANEAARRNQELLHLSEETERKRVQREAAAEEMARAREAIAQEAEFQSVISATASTVRRTHGDGRRANLARSLQNHNRQPAGDQLVR